MTPNFQECQLTKPCDPCGHFNSTDQPNCKNCGRPQDQWSNEHVLFCEAEVPATGPNSGPETSLDKALLDATDRSILEAVEETRQGIQGEQVSECVELESSTESVDDAPADALREVGSATAMPDSARFVRCRLQPQDVAALQELLDSHEVAHCFPDRLVWSEKQQSFEQTLPTGCAASSRQCSSDVIFQASKLVQKLHALGLRVNCLRPSGLVIDDSTGDCVGLCLPASLCRMDCPAEDTPVSGLNCCFAAPEVQQFIGGEAGVTTDVYALAGLFFHLFTKQPADDLCARGFEWDLSHPELTPAMVAVLGRAFSLDPQDRYPNVAQFTEELYQACLERQSKSSIAVHGLGASHIGMGGRDQNEDAFAFKVLSNSNFSGCHVCGIAVVSDGIGGGTYGEMASRICVESLASLLEKPREVLGDRVLTPAQWAHSLTGSIHELNQSLMELSVSLKADANFGATLSGMIWFGTHAMLFQVGDSVIYRLRDGRLHQLSQTQNLGTQLLNGGQPCEEIDEENFRILVSSMGSHACYPQIENLDLLPGDLYLLISDGILEGLDPADLEKVLLAHTNPAEMIQDLFATCRKKIRQKSSAFTAELGSYESDNMTALLLCVNTLELVLGDS